MSRGTSSSLRFAFAVSAIFAAATLVALGVSYVFQARDLSIRLRSDVERMAQSLATSDPQDLGEQIAALIATEPDGALIVANQGQNGQMLGNAASAARFLGGEHLDTARGLRLLGPSTGRSSGGSFVYGLTVTDGWLMVGRNDAWITENREILLQSYAWGLAAALLLSIALTTVVARRNEARIARMQGVLEAVGEGDHARRIGETGRDDLARVARGVDGTLDQLEAGMPALRQVSTDVAHDLRAPLSRLRLQSGTAPLTLEPLDLSALTSEVTVLHHDGLGSVRAVTSGSGARTETSSYKPFGFQSEGTYAQNTPEAKGYIGTRFDAAAGLQYLDARYYDPQLGMFLQPDWWEVTQPGVGTNRYRYRYSYSFNDPVNGKDPTGHERYSKDKNKTFTKEREETIKNDYEKVRKQLDEKIRDLKSICSIPDDHIAPRRSALFMARLILREVREGVGTC